MQKFVFLLGHNSYFKKAQFFNNTYGVADDFIFSIIVHNLLSK